MTNKFFILNADDFGLSPGSNNAVLQAYKAGFLKSVSICSNGEAFEPAVREILPRCPLLGIGIHLNIIEGKALTGISPLTNAEGIFNNGFVQLMLKSGDESILKDIEAEFRAQIEKLLKYTKIDHIDSHVHTHAIPGIFKIALKLAVEFNIPYIRTQYEKAYFVPKVRKILTLKFPLNLVKIFLLNTFTRMNRKVLRQTAIKTNDLIIGVGYTGMMDESTIEYGTKAAAKAKKVSLVETLIHPNTDTHVEELLAAMDKNLENRIGGMGFKIMSYRELFSGGGK
jgi:predicted glycoside hydrolase/deacetylase ChbG (UPF0249 family)